MQTIIMTMTMLLAMMQQKLQMMTMKMLWYCCTMRLHNSTSCLDFFFWKKKNRSYWYLVSCKEYVLVSPLNRLALLQSDSFFGTSIVRLLVFKSQWCLWSKIIKMKQKLKENLWCCVIKFIKWTFDMLRIERRTIQNMYVVH